MPNILTKEFKGGNSIMRKAQMLFMAGLLLGAMTLSTVPAFADATNVAIGDKHFANINLGEDYTTTLPVRLANAGNYDGNSAWTGQTIPGGSMSLNYGVTADGGGYGGQTTGYLQDITPLTGLTNGDWFLPCPIGTPMGAAVHSDDFDATPSDGISDCAAMVDSGETEEPQTDDIGLGAPGTTDNANDVTFKQGLLNSVYQDWVDTNVPNVELDANTNTVVAGDPYDSSFVNGWTGTLDQDLAALFLYAGAVDTAGESGGGETGVPSGPYLGIDQTLDQGLAYLNGTGIGPIGLVSDTDIRGYYGNAQRIVQTFELTDTQFRTSSGLQVSGEGSLGADDLMHQWVHDWMRDTNTVIGAPFTTGDLAGTGFTKWDLETLLSTSVLQEGADDGSCNNTTQGLGAGTDGCSGETYIHQINNQLSTVEMSATGVTSLTGSQNDSGNGAADVLSAYQRVSQQLGMEFWHAQTSHIPYDVSVSGIDTQGEEVTGSFGTVSGDHNPLNNGP
jgi:hypothetical protein